MRTVVVSDSHASPHLLKNAVEHAERSGKVDQVIFAGDFLDIGPEPKEMLEVLKEYCDVVLVGNHDTSAAFQIPISPQDPASFHFGPEIHEKVASGEWKLAHVVDGFLITHAGVSCIYDRHFELCDRDLEAFSEYLNNRFLDEYLDILDHKRPLWGSILLNDDSPLWYRPDAGTLLKGVKQIVGHTPIGYYTSFKQEKFRRLDIYFVDPYSRKHGMDGTWYKYALIEDGEVSVHQGNLELEECAG